jgi:hypothetical protein
LRTTSPFASRWILNIGSPLKLRTGDGAITLPFVSHCESSNENLEECRSPGQLTKLRTIITRYWNAFHRVALFHVAHFKQPFVMLNPMMDASCSFEFFPETLDGARRSYLN